MSTRDQNAPKGLKYAVDMTAHADIITKCVNHVQELMDGTPIEVGFIVSEMLYALAFNQVRESMPKKMSSFDREQMAEYSMKRHINNIQYHLDHRMDWMGQEANPDTEGD